MNKVVKESDNIIIAGDFNIDLLKITEREKYAEFLDIMLTFGYLPRINYPTRYARKSATLIDQIFVRSKLTSMIDQTSVAGILHTAISDHFELSSRIALRLLKQILNMSRFINRTKPR